VDGADRVSTGPAPIVALVGSVPTTISRTNGGIECMFVTRFLRDSGKRAHRISDSIEELIDNET